MTLKIGDPWPFASARGFTGAPIAPVWHALITTPQREAKTAHKLEIAGAEVHYPTITKVRHIKGKKREFTQPMISQIIYACFSYAPNWDVMKERKLITGVFSRGNIPVELREADVMRIMGLPTEAERLERERIEAMTPKVGERVQLTTGLFEGFWVDVERTEAGRVWYDSLVGVGKMKGEASVDEIKRAG